MSYTEEEIEFIKKAFKITRNSFEYELLLDNSEHIMEAVNLWNDKLGLGPNDHDMMEIIFRKNGFYRDGKTTLEKHKRNLFERKIAIEKQLSIIKAKEIGKIDGYIEQLQTAKEKMNSIPKIIQLELINESDRILKEAETRLDNIKNKKMKDIQRVVLDFNKKTDEKTKEIFSETRIKLEKIKNIKLKQLQEQVKLESEKIHQKVGLLMSFNIREAETKKLQEEIEKIESQMINVEIIIDEPIKDGFDQYTVKQLKTMAAQKGIIYDSLIRKADLIKLIEDN